MQADAGSFVVSLANALKGYKCDEEWAKLLKDRDTEKENSNV